MRRYHYHLPPGQSPMRMMLIHHPKPCFLLHGALTDSTSVTEEQRNDEGLLRGVETKRGQPSLDRTCSLVLRVSSSLTCRVREVRETEKQQVGRREDKLGYIL